MVARRRLACLFAFVLLTFALGPLRAAESLPAQIELPTMKTSIYIGSVTLITSAFTPLADTYAATYEAKVSPWSFWSEAGTITLAANPDAYNRLLRGETIEITGEAKNGKGKLRQVSARAEPVDARSGRIKIRIAARGTQLIFNSTYQVTAAPVASSAVAAAD